MSKSAVPTSVEVVHPGQLSAELLAKLRQAGEHLTDEQVIAAVDHADTERVAFQSAAIVAGVFLLARKQSVKHGEWLPWCEKFAGQVVTKLAARCQFEMKQEATARSLRVYTQLAQRFLADLEQKSFAPEKQDERVTPPAVTPEEVLTLEALPHERRIAVHNQLARFVAGRSLRRMLIDFRAAENAADAEELEEAKGQRGKGKPIAGSSPGQMDFFQDMLRPLGEIETLFEQKSFIEKTDRAFWVSIADKLEAQARKARQLAKEIK